MSDPVVNQKLKQNRAEISGVISAYLARIVQAKRDLAPAAMLMDALPQAAT